MANEPKLTGFIISLILFGFFVGIFGLLYSEMQDKYGVDYQNESLAVYQNLEEMHAEAESYQDTISDVGADKNFLERAVDVIGGLVSSGISAVKITFRSITVFMGMADAAEGELNQAGLGATAGYLRIMVGAVVLVLLFVGILLPIILRMQGKL